LAIATIAIRRAHRVRESDALKFGYVYHYTSQKTFDDLFPADPKPDAEKSSKKAAKPSKKAPKLRRKLILSPTELLNDPNEGAHFFENLRGIPEIKMFKSLQGLGDIPKLVDGALEYRRKMRINSGLTASDPLVFTASLCIEQDNLNLWRFYGSAKGVSFGIHYLKFDYSEEGIDDDYRTEKLYHVKYGVAAVHGALRHMLPALRRIAEFYVRDDCQPLRGHMEKAVSSLLGTVAYLFKTESYSAEKECRLLRIQSVSDVRKSKHCRNIGGFVRIESNLELVHDNIKAPPILTLGPQFDGINPERGQMWVVDRIRAAMPDRHPIVKLSAMKYRA
jgi:hypothetical protein